MKRVFLIFVTLFVLVSCEKDENIKTPPQADCWISWEFYDGNLWNKNNSRKYGFVYESNRIKTAYSMGILWNTPNRTIENTEDYETYVFDYYDDKIKVKPFGNTVGEWIYKLDEGKIVSREYHMGNSISEQKYLYNDDGYLLRIYNVGGAHGGDSDLLDEITYEDGNIVTFKSQGRVRHLKYSNRKRVPYTEYILHITFYATGGISLPEAILYEQGFLGELPKNEIISIEEYEGKTALDYIYNDKEAVKEMTLQRLVSIGGVWEFTGQTEKYHFNCN